MNSEVTTTPAPAKGSRLRTLLRELSKFLAVLVFIVLPFRLFIAQPFIVSGSSMEPTFHNGDYLIVNQLSMYFDDPTRYDVVVFRYPNDPQKFFIKRVIGLPGERVKIVEGMIRVFNQSNPEGLIIESKSASGNTYGDIDVTLESGEYFVLGDNRENSSDSRVWGALPRDNIVGTPMVRLLPLAQASVYPGDELPD